MRRKITVVLFLTCSIAALSQTLPFKLHDGYVIVAKCSAAGRPDLTAIIDTGVSETVIDVALARTLGLALHSDQAVFVDKEAAVWAVSIPQVQLGPVTADSLAGIAADLSRLKETFGIHPDLLIGMDLLHRSSFIVDYKLRLLTFGSASALVHEAKLSEDSRFVLVDSTISGKTLRLQVDTGLNGILLYAKRLSLESPAFRAGAHMMGVSASSAVREVDAEVRIGSWRSRGTPISLLDGEPAQGYFDGMLGARTLTSRRIAFDFERGMVYWD